MGDALEAMITWMQSLYGLSKGTALAVASTTVDLRITQVANDVWGVHALLRDGVLRPGG
jgi:acetamidase/formamidase